MDEIEQMCQMGHGSSGFANILVTLSITMCRDEFVPSQNVLLLIDWRERLKS